MHSRPGLTLQRKNGIVAENAGVMSSGLACAFYIVSFISLLVSLISILDSVRCLQSICHQATSKFVFGDLLRESDPGFRSSVNQGTWVLVFSLLFLWLCGGLSCCGTWALE